MYKPHWCCDDSGRSCLAFAYQVAQFHESRRRIAKGEERVGVFLYGQPYAGLGAGDGLLRRHLGHASVAQIAFSLYA